MNAIHKATSGQRGSDSEAACWTNARHKFPNEVKSKGELTSLGTRFYKPLLWSVILKHKHVHII